jgi:hypothetical protein
LLPTRQDARADSVHLEGFAPYGDYFLSSPQLFVNGIEAKGFEQVVLLCPHTALLSDVAGELKTSPRSDDNVLTAKRMMA